MMMGKLPHQVDLEDEPDSIHRFVPARGLDARSSVFGSRLVQAKVVEQFSLPKDGELLRSVPDLGLHEILRSYLTRGCLVEQELHRRLTLGHRAYEKLEKASKGSCETNEVELSRVVADLSATQAELDGWRREMKVREQTLAELKASDSRKSAEIQQLKQRLHRVAQESSSTGTTTELLRERDRVAALAAMEKQVADHAKSQLEDERVERKRLQERCAQLEEALRLSESKASQPESSACESAIVAKNRAKVIEEFRGSPLGKLEVALACKAGCDYIMAQLPSELRESRDCPHYPPSVADHIGLLIDMEDKGHGYDLGEDGDEDGSSEASSQSPSGSSGGPKGDDDDVGLAGT